MKTTDDDGGDDDDDDGDDTSGSSDCCTTTQDDSSLLSVDSRPRHVWNIPKSFVRLGGKGVLEKRRVYSQETIAKKIIQNRKPNNQRSSPSQWVTNTGHPYSQNWLQCQPE